MKTFISSILCTVAFFVADVLDLRAEPPTPTVGTVLVLEGEHTMEGDIERVGEQYRVRHPVGGETWIPAKGVLRLCPTTDDALTFLRGRANLEDPDERLRLARWCQVHGLHDQALVEAQAALQMRPNHVPSKCLLNRLQRPTAQRTATTDILPPAEPEPAAPVELTVEAIAQFTTKIQPILMNTCANCHANGHGGSFKLARVNDNLSLNRKAMQQNLAAVIAQVNANQPQHSRLLTKAVTLHGDMEKTPPIANRQAIAYRTLEEWIRLTLANNPQLQDHVVALPPSAPAESKAPAATPFASEANTTTAPPRTEELSRPGGTTPLAKPGDKTPTSEPADPYDPNEFNRQVHPERMLPATPAKQPS